VHTMATTFCKRCSEAYVSCAGVSLDLIYGGGVEGLEVVNGLTIDGRAANILLSATSSARASMLMASCARRSVVGVSRWVGGEVGGEVDIGAVVSWCGSSGLQTYEWKGRWTSSDGSHITGESRL